MKKLLAVFGFAMLAVASQAGAATLTLVGGTAQFGNTVSGAFSDDYSFVVPKNIGGSAHISNSTIKGFGKIKGFSAKLDNQTFVPEKSGSIYELHLDDFLALVPGLHHLVVSGTGITKGAGITTASYSGNIAIAQTPIPAAVWLFGSALMGLTGLKRRKAA